ncbi:lipopolysaccharide biosynthesis protein [Asticcacaulis sp. AND118]|uniref:lipopolysaccharide biosynthesis protein n=1 Tax=Asticcacaulis sp. AND118 TaxID=2840468 RepID=UPI001D0005FC|nr:oligosaccharide flippase family protein [Asticcacaulis sp. AND118]UDF05042.1 oligosaccharide flippase family protein [Asticcacaulis sp. AND118]
MLKSLLTPLTNMGLRGFGLVGRFALSFFLIKYLGTTQTGQFGLIVGVAGILPALYGFGMNYFLGREVIKSEISDAFAHIRDKFLIISSLLILTFVGALIFNFFHEISALGNLYIASLVIFLEVISFDMHIMLVNLRKPLLANVLVVIRSASWVFPFIGLSYFYPEFRTLDVLLNFWLAALLINFAMVWLFTRDWPWRSTLKRPIDFQWIKKTVQTSGLIYLSDLGLVVYSYFDRFFLAAKLGLAAAGVYTFFWTMANALLVLIGVAVVQVSLPTLVDAFSESKAAWRTKFRQLMTKAVLGSAVLSGLMYVGVLFIMPFLNNPELSHHPLIFPVMLFSVIVKIAADMTHFGLYSANKDKTLAIINISGIFVNTLLTFVFVSHFGLIGSALSMMGTAFYLLFSRGYFLLRNMNTPRIQT